MGKTTIQGMILGLRPKICQRCREVLKAKMARKATAWQWEKGGGVNVRPSFSHCSRVRTMTYSAQVGSVPVGTLQTSLLRFGHRFWLVRKRFGDTTSVFLVELAERLLVARRMKKKRSNTDLDALFSSCSTKPEKSEHRSFAQLGEGGGTER